ncbi:MAG: hypothetical protein K5654_09745, partial [Lachnospiraceae bacterium]|nr:hypothetical protein [Lachnospiraceae bacterium]
CPHFERNHRRANVDMMSTLWRKSMRVLRFLGKLIIKILVGILQIPLTIVYFVLSLVGSIASGLGWFFGLIIFGVALVLCFFGEFDSTREMLSVFGIAAALFIIPNFLVNLIGDGILFLKDALSLWSS